MKKVLLFFFVAITLALQAQQATSIYTTTVARGARYSLLTTNFDYHINVDTTGGVVDTTKIYLPTATYLGQEYLVTNSTQDTTKPVVIYAAGTDKLETTASGTATLTFKPSIKATSIRLRWVAGQSGWKILYKY